MTEIHPRPLDLSAPAQEAAAPKSLAARPGLKTLLALAALAAILIGSFAAPWLAPHDPYAQNLAMALAPPSWETGYLFGADMLGRDVLSRVLHGGRPPVLIALAAVLIAAAVGVSLGLLSGYVGGALDAALVAFSDMQLAIPGLIMALLILVLFGGSMENVILVIALESWPLHYRIARTHAQAVRKLAYVEAASLAGVGHGRILLRHVLPGAAPVLAVAATMNFGAAVLAEASLSFLGMGIQPPTPDWGQMVADGQSQLGWAWWTAVFPALALLILLLSVQVLGDRLADRFGRGKE